MNFSTDELAKNMRMYRAAANISQAELARRTGCGVDSIVRYENGSNTPGADKLCSIARALEVTPNDLIGWPSSR